MSSKAEPKTTAPQQKSLPATPERSDSDPAALHSYQHLRKLQRAIGNQGVGRWLQRQSRSDAGGTSTVSTPPAAVRPRPSLSELVTIANGAINAEYVGAARDGLSDFESAMSTTFDFGSFATAQLGNIIWAAACFTTGGTAFVISLSGIGVAAAAPAASSVTDRASFHQAAAQQIEGIRTNLLNEIARVTTDIDQQATAQGWNDFQTRQELLRRLLRPEYIQMATGGLPTVNRAAIAHQIARDLTIKANAFSSGIIFDSGGSFIYDYTVSGHFTEHGFWPFDSVSLTPINTWQFNRGRTEVYLTQGDDAAFRILTQDPLLQPATMPFGKVVYINSDLVIRLDGQNNIINVETYGVFEKLGVPPSRPASRSAPPPADPEGAARRVIAQMWSTTGGQPPWVRGQDLTRASLPGRSRATR